MIYDAVDGIRLIKYFFERGMLLFSCLQQMFYCICLLHIVIFQFFIKREIMLIPFLSSELFFQCSVFQYVTGTKVRNIIKNYNHEKSKF